MPARAAIRCNLRAPCPDSGSSQAPPAERGLDVPVQGRGRAVDQEVTDDRRLQEGRVVR